MTWIERYGDLDGDGFIEYRRRTDRGLVNQGWKDSLDRDKRPIDALASNMGHCLATGIVDADKAGAVRALTEAQEHRGGEAVYLDEVARSSGMPRDRVRALLHDLARVHRLITVLEQTDAPDMGPRFEVKSRR
jgi:hypothetical protein